MSSSQAFPDADRLLVLDIYAASEQPIAGVSGLTLAQKIRCRNGHPAEFAASFAAAVEAVVEQAQPGDVVLTLGAGIGLATRSADSGEAACPRAGRWSLNWTLHRMMCNEQVKERGSHSQLTTSRTTAAGAGNH